MGACIIRDWQIPCGWNGSPTMMHLQRSHTPCQLLERWLLPFTTGSEGRMFPKLFHIIARSKYHVPATTALSGRALFLHSRAYPAFLRSQRVRFRVNGCDSRRGIPGLCLLIRKFHLGSKNRQPVQASLNGMPGVPSRWQD